MLNGGYTFEKYVPHCLIRYKEGDVMINGSGDERSQTLTCSHSFSSDKPEYITGMLCVMAHFAA